MHSTIEFLLHHGYAVLLAWVFGEQIGLPVPTMPLLLAAGALAGAGRLNFFSSLFLCMVAAVCADSIWYQLGRKKGIRILQLLCKISLEPDSCVRRTEGVFSRQGPRSLLFAKFLPGLGTVAPPLAGIFRMKPHRFLFFDALGALLWAGTYLAIGFVFSGEIERIATHASTLGGWLLVILLGGLAGYIVWKFIARRRFLSELRVSRITVDELKEKMDAGENITIVDLRHSLEFEAQPETIPGAFRMDAKEIQEKNDRLPRDREVILFCT
jgi:membrane protein DedA with SNARE-associated domain